MGLAREAHGRDGEAILRSGEGDPPAERQALVEQAQSRADGERVRIDRGQRLAGGAVVAAGDATREAREPGPRIVGDVDLRAGQAGA